MPGCCVPGCANTSPRRHRFPKPHGISAWKHLAFKIWVHRIKNEELSHYSEERIYMKFRVCDAHFTDNCRFPAYDQLVHGSLPTLGLPGYVGEPNEANSQLAVLQNVPGSEEMKLFGDIMYKDRGIVRKSRYASYNTEPFYDNTRKILQEVAGIVDNEPAQMYVEETEPYVEETQPIVEEEQTESGEAKKPSFQSIKIYFSSKNSFSEVCRICFCPIENQDMVKLYEDTPDGIKDKLVQILPDVNLEIYPKPVVCQKCKDLIVSSFELREKWRATEETLRCIIKNDKLRTDRNSANLVLVPIIKETDVKVANEECWDHDYARKEGIDSAESQQVEEPQQPPEEKREDIFDVEESDEFQGALFDGDSTVNVKGLVYSIEDLERQEFYKNVSHSTVVWGLPPYLCEICGAIVTTKGGFKRHLFRHLKKREKEREVICEICGTISEGHKALDKHIKRVHEAKKKKPPEKIQYVCPVCGKLITTKHSLSKHIRTAHMNIHDYVQCHLCGKKLKDRTQLRAHILRHQGIKRFACGQCGKKFGTKAHCQLHESRHTDVRHECDICGRLIKNLSKLEMHKKIFHFNEGEFYCEFCGRPYWKKLDLMRHRIRIHGWGPEQQSVDNSEM